MSAAPEKPVSFAAVAQAVFDANPFLPPWAPCSPIGKSRHWLGDPLLPAAGGLSPRGHSRGPGH
ncbi:hypothetical protein [Pseudomonas costantinii]|uniref:Uncharacterized protein n=1 Tax=Pseudomonas costantinii TaxID=168469 RepID=A0A1H4U0E8_9PSED|nr:hypothetical protein [Pseudomonas costantinii]SEC62020.1 hypothetical protein SAMN04515675_0007 [Pseudomonas costantinii]